jgi:SAM-dependent methyltransferase
VEAEAGAGQQYILGNRPEELARLDRQAASIERPTRLLLQAAGIGPGMRVLDLGTGLGHVARMVADMVGPSGTVVGLDRSPEVLAAARDRTQQGPVATRVTFIEGDVGTWRATEPFDAIVERLLLFHVPDPAAVVRHHLTNVRPGGLFVAIDFDLGGSRTEPEVPFVNDAVRWVHDAFRATGAWPRIGARLGPILEDAGLERVGALGVQAYFSYRQPQVAGLLAGVVRSLAPAIVSHGIATTEDLQLDTLEQRLAGEIQQAGAVVLTPTVAGAWGYAPGDRRTLP